MVVQQFTVSGHVIRILPVVQTSVKTTNEVKLYSLFERTTNGWKRVRQTAFSLGIAYRIWGEFTVESRYSIRKIKIESLRVN